MKDTNRSDDWRVLCDLASKETDPEKLVDLIIQINQALVESHQKSRYYARTYSCGSAFQFSQPKYDC
jgi:hypothetical protein